MNITLDMIDAAFPSVSYFWEWAGEVAPQTLDELRRCNYTSLAYAIHFKIESAHPNKVIFQHDLDMIVGWISTNAHKLIKGYPAP